MALLKPAGGGHGAGVFYQYAGAYLLAGLAAAGIIVAGEQATLAVLFLIIVAFLLVAVIFKLQPINFLLLVIFVTPLGVLTVIPGTHTTVRPFLGVAVGAYWLGSYLLTPQRSLIVTREFKWLLLFLVIALLTSLLGVDRAHSLGPMFTYFQLTIMVFLMLQMITSDKQVKALNWVLLASLLVAGLLLIGTGLGLWDISSYGATYSGEYKRVSSVYDSVGNSGYIMFVSLLTSYCMLRLSKGLLGRCLALTGAVVSVAGIFFTLTLSSMVAMAVAMPLVLMRRLRLSLRWVAVYLVCLAALFGGLYVGYAPFSARLQNHYERFISHKDIRYLVWKASWQVVKEHPATGVGAGNTEGLVGYNFPVWHPWFGRSRSAHNTFLSLAGDHGLLGVMAFCLALALVIRELYRCVGMAEKRKHTQLAILCQTALASLVGSLVVMVFLTLEREDLLWILMGGGMALINICHRTLGRDSLPAPAAAGPAAEQE